MPVRKVWDSETRYHWEEYEGEETWQEKEARKPRALRTARLEAILIWEGHDVRSEENTRRLALVYRSDQARPEATFIRWRKQKEAQMLVDQELEKMAARHGITRDSVIAMMAALPEAMTTDTGKLESVKMLARLVGVPVEKQPADGGNTMGLVYGRGQSSGYYAGPPPLSEGYVPPLLEDSSTYQQTDDDYEDAEYDDLEDGYSEN